MAKCVFCVGLTAFFAWVSQTQT